MACERRLILYFTNVLVTLDSEIIDTVMKDLTPEQQESVRGVSLGVFLVILGTLIHAYSVSSVSVGNIFRKIKK